MTSSGSHLKLIVTFLAPEQAGRTRTPPLQNQRYRPHLRVPPDEEMLGVEFIDGPEGFAPARVPVHATVRLVYEPAVSYAALQPGSYFEIMEGARIVGYGEVVSR